MLVADDEERLGWLSIQSGEYQIAERHFRQALAVDPFRADALNGLGVILLKEGDLEQARELFEMALSHAEQELPRRKRHTGWNDDSVRPYLRGLYYMALLFIQDDHWDQVRQPLEELVAWDSSGIDGEAYYLLGQAYHRLGRLEEAIDAYRNAQDHYAEVTYSIGLAYFDLKKMQEARRIWQEAIRQFPEIALFVSYYPRVRPIPLKRSDSTHFLQASRYIEQNGDLWTEESRRTLNELTRGEVASGNG